MNKFIFVLLIICISPTAHAKYFFMANDYDITACVQTPLETKKEIKKKLESSSSMTCKGVEDNHGSIIMTCEGILTNMYVFSKTKAGCESMHESFKTMLGH